MKDPIKIAIVDDHQIFLDGMLALLGNEKRIDIVGTALDGKALLTLLDSTPVDVVLLDMNMPVMNGLETTQRIKAEHANTHVLMLTMQNDKDAIAELLQAGVTGYVLKNTNGEELMLAIETVAAGETYYSDMVTKTMMQSFRPRSSSHTNIVLTSREVDVLKLITDGFTAAEIADKLCISQHTVDSHRKNLLSKIGARNTAGLVRYALENSIM